MLYEHFWQVSVYIIERKLHILTVPVTSEMLKYRDGDVQ